MRSVLTDEMTNSSKRCVMGGEALTDLIEKGEPEDAIWTACIALGDKIEPDFFAVADVTFQAITMTGDYERLR
jgi:hypothetical protein